MPDTLSYSYTSAAEINRRMSAGSVEDYAEDDPDSLATDPDQNLQDAVDEATDTINLYCLGYYAESNLNANSWVRTQATWLACYYLTSRRAEPSPYKPQYDRVIEHLNQIQLGILQVPRAALRSDFSPTHSNHVIDDRFAKRRSRVQPETSTGSNYSNRPTDVVIDPYPFS